MKLSDLKIKNLSVPGKYFDGGGLYFELTGAGGRYWRLKYRHLGKEKRLAFGVYPAVSLREARDRAVDAKRALHAGVDPGMEKKEAKARALNESNNTLEAASRDWLEHQSARWAAVTSSRITSAFEADIFPKLGSRPLASIKPGELMDAIKAIESRGAGDQAGRVLQRVKSVYRWAVTHGRIESNPMVDLVISEILKPRTVRHRAAMPSKELPEFLKKLDAYDGDINTVNALRFLMLTATRPGEARGALWEEFDTKEGIWTIPGIRMKMNIEHRVPLSKQALGVLRTMQAFSGTNEAGLVFPSPFYPSKSLSENTFNSALARMGYKNIATAHGFRALFSTVANETGWNPDVIERQLAHKEQNTVRAAYHRSTYMQDRVLLMQWWADYLDGRKAGKTLKHPKASVS